MSMTMMNGSTSASKPPSGRRSGFNTSSSISQLPIRKSITGY
jgi:hypothetical protein